MSMRKDAAEHRRQILQTAQALFLEHGVDKVSMHQIAKSVGIGQGTLYRNYTNKADLCLDIIQDSARSADADIVAVLQDRQDAPARERLELVLFRMLDFIEDKLQWLGAMQVNACPEGRMTYYKSPIYETLHGRLLGLIKVGIERGECQEHIDPVFTADAILAVVDPDLYLFLRTNRGYSQKQIKANLSRVYLDPLFNRKG